jgi:hypothetical protein
VNVKEIVFGQNIETEVKLDTSINTELKEEGEKNELRRALNDGRKDRKMTPNDKAILIIDDSNKEAASYWNKILNKHSSLLKACNISEVKLSKTESSNAVTALIYENLSTFKYPFEFDLKKG